MPAVIDLEPFFTPDAIAQAYRDLKESKTDRFEHEVVRISMGADGIIWQDFERNLQRNVVNISRRVLNGSYQFYPLRVVEKDKEDGSKRLLSIACIRDALVQRLLYKALYESAEEMFATSSLDRVSFAYRKGKSAPRAARRLWRAYKTFGYRFALDADIRKLFDTLDHERLRDLIDQWVSQTSISGRLLWKYIRTDRVPYNSYPHGPGWKKYFMTNKPERESRTAGVPQGGVLSGLLANLYLHEFDRWVIQEIGSEFDLRYFRYADDFVILTKSHSDASAIYEPVETKLIDLKLTLHPDKTEVRDIDSKGLTFVGFCFSRKFVKAKPKTVKRFQDKFLKSLKKEQSLSAEYSSWYERFRLTIRYCVNPKILGPAPEICETCHLPKTHRRNWTAFFASAVTDVDQLRQLDRWMRGKVCKYFRDKYRVRIGVKRLRQAQMKSLVGEYYRQRYRRTTLCSCGWSTDSGVTDASSGTLISTSEGV